MTRTLMTKEGANRLKEERYRLKNIERPRIIQAIAEARAHGDLRENAEYAAAKEQQGFIESRLAEIEAKLSTAQVIDITEISRTGKVVFGSTVTLLNLNTEEQVAYTIVGEDEADLRIHKISVTSPIARAVIAKEPGDVAGVDTPSGVVEYEVIEVQYGYPVDAKVQEQ